MATAAGVIGAIRGLSPFGPIFGKELRTTARRKRTYVLRFGYLGVLLAILLMFFAVWSISGAAGAGNSGVARRAQRLSEMGTYFFVTFSIFTMIAMALVGPILTATAINAERLHKTLPVLLMTPISAWQVVAGKLFSRLLIALTLIGLSLPVLAVVRLLGGVETHQVFAIITLSIVTVLWTASIGLLLSTLMNRPYAVILLSYGLLGIIYLLVPLLVILVVENMIGWRGGGIERTLAAIASFGHPAFATAMICIPEARVGAQQFFDWYWPAGVHLVLSALLVMISALILRRMARKENEGGGGAGTANVAARRIGRKTNAAPVLAGEASDAASSEPVQEQPEVVRKPKHRRRAGGLFGAGSTDVYDNPVLWREIRRPLVARRWQAIAVTIFFVGILLFIYGTLYAGSDLDEPDVQMGFASVFCGILTLLACVLAGTAIAQEKESDTWTLLLATPISARRIVLGKVGGLLRRMMWPSAMIVAHFLIFTIAGVINWTTLWVILWMTFTTNLIWIATGVYLSLRLKTVTFAVILNLLAPAILYGGAAIALTIAGAVLARDDDWAEAVGLYAPYAYMLSAIDDLNDAYQHNYNYYANGSYGSRWSYDTRQVWVPVIDRVPEREFILIVFGVGILYLLASAGIVWLMIVRFNRIVGRAVQHVPFLPPAMQHRPITGGAA
jgi:ABC-type transport system involved in multi-copper enzyme maturation permease subunit